ncbi:hypothetical protein GQ607_016705, partial [Colletotrichum asianum]
AKVNKVLIKLNYIYKAKRIVFKKGYKEVLVVVDKDNIVKSLLSKSSLVLEV